MTTVIEDNIHNFSGETPGASLEGRELKNQSFSCLPCSPFLLVHICMQICSSILWGREYLRIIIGET